MKKSFFLLPLIGACAATHGAITSIDYGFESALASAGFAASNPTETVVTAGIGIGPSAGLSALNNGAARMLMYTADFFDLSAADASISVGVSFFHTTDTSNGTTSADRNIILGIKNNTSTARFFDNAGPANYVGIALNSPSSGSAYEFQLLGESNNGGTLSVSAGTDYTPTDNTWYRMEATLSRTSATGWTVSAELFSLGANGLSAPSSVLTYAPSGSINVAAGMLDSGYFGLQVGENDLMSASAYDNITVAVPEPSTYALALGFLALGAVMLRRRLRG
jgi:hypothetical protein